MNGFARNLVTLFAVLLAMVGAPPARAADTVAYYHTDALHSVSVVTDAQGQVIERTRYAPYGQVLNRPLRDGPGYTGHREDAATGLVYMQQRYYDPEVGRFLSVDPLEADAEKDGNFNRYWYANNNPYRYTDPDGRATGTLLKENRFNASKLTIIAFAAEGAAKAQRPLASSLAATNHPGAQLLASNSRAGDSVKGDEARNGLSAAAKEYESLVKLGIIRPSALVLFGELLARGGGSANTAYDAGMIAAGGARITFESAYHDIRFYINTGRAPGPTGIGYPGSLLQWGKYVSWQPFDPGLDNSQGQIWVNFLITSGIYSRSHGQ